MRIFRGACGVVGSRSRGRVYTSAAGRGTDTNEQQGGDLPWVVIPAYNERENLPVVVRVIMGHGDFRVMAVDDQSPNGIGEVADALAREFPDRVEAVHHAGRRGLGLSLRRRSSSTSKSLT